MDNMDWTSFTLILLVLLSLVLVVICGAGGSDDVAAASANAQQPVEPETILSPALAEIVEQAEMLLSDLYEGVNE